MRTVHGGPLTVLPGVAASWHCSTAAVGLGVPALVTGAVLTVVLWAARARAAPGGPRPARTRQHRDPRPRRSGRGDHGARRAVVEQRGAPLAGRGAERGRAGARLRRRPAGARARHRHGPGRGVRHGDRRLPDPRPLRVRRTRRRRVGAADRPRPLRAAARHVGLAVAGRSRCRARPWAKVVAAVQGIVLVVAAAEVLPTAWAQVLLFAALVLLLESFGRQVVTLWRHRSEHPVPRSPLVRPVLDALALALVWLALVLPQRPDQLTAAVLLGDPGRAAGLPGSRARAAVRLGALRGGGRRSVAGRRRRRDRARPRLLRGSRPPVQPDDRPGLPRLRPGSAALLAGPGRARSSPSARSSSRSSSAPRCACGRSCAPVVRSGRRHGSGRQ